MYTTLYGNDPVIYQIMPIRLPATAYMLPEPTCFVNNDSTGDLLPTDGFVYNKSINIKTSAFFLGRNSSMQ